MSIRIKCVIIVVLILGLLKILGLIKKNKMELKYALSWLFSGAWDIYNYVNT